MLRHPVTCWTHADPYGSSRPKSRTSIAGDYEDFERRISRLRKWQVEWMKRRIARCNRDHFQMNTRSLLTATSLCICTTLQYTTAKDGSGSEYQTNSQKTIAGKSIQAPRLENWRLTLERVIDKRFKELAPPNTLRAFKDDTSCKVSFCVRPDGAKLMEIRLLEESANPTFNQMVLFLLRELLPSDGLALPPKLELNRVLVCGVFESKTEVPNFKLQETKIITNSREWRQGPEKRSRNGPNHETGK